MAAGRQLWWMLIALCLSGQAGAAHVETVRIDPDRIDAVAKIPFKCAYRLGSVIDQRPVGEEAGSLGWRRYILDNAAGVVDGQLRKSGFSDVSAVQAPSVDVMLMRLYIQQNLYTNLPIVVYQAKIDGGEPFVVRSQIGKMTWTAGEDKAYDGYALALRDANERLISELNARCR